MKECRLEKNEYFLSRCAELRHCLSAANGSLVFIRIPQSNSLTLVFIPSFALPFVVE